MKPISFVKYQGTGNDFILMDNRRGNISLNQEKIALLCHRRFGIGADGLMLLESSARASFRMVYFNADGGESSMCGNGGRCIVAFAQRLGILQGPDTEFEAIDGLHRARIEPDGIVSLHMNDVPSIRQDQGQVLLNTGSPHCVVWVDDVQQVAVVREGRRIRQEARFAPGGTNVNFVSRLGARRIAVRTYERGVEDETLSCGTGVTAAALAASEKELGRFSYEIETPGGGLQVQFEKSQPDSAHSVILRGPAVCVFEGSLDV
ncbi:MAG: diaminopimelate epimerase [Bacteroidetes bacterium]|nr:diaminopimelate epimerase [Bacteroidota bacterium]